MHNSTEPVPAAGVSTLLVHGDAHVRATSAISPPIFQTATFRAPDADAFLAAATATHPPAFYTRYGNRTHAHAEAIVAALEGAEAALLLGSGMGAISTTVLSLVGAGD